LNSRARAHEPRVPGAALLHRLEPERRALHATIDFGDWDRGSRMCRVRLRREPAERLGTARTSGRQLHEKDRRHDEGRKRGYGSQEGESRGKDQLELGLRTPGMAVR